MAGRVQLLKNGSFEDEEWTDHIVPESNLILQIPRDWSLDYLIPDQALFYGDGTAQAVPECRHLRCRHHLPVEECVDGSTPLVLSGEWTYKIFVGTGFAFGAQLRQEVSGLEPGSVVEVRTPIQIHKHTEADPQTVGSRLCVNDIKGAWMTLGECGDRTWYYHTQKITVPENGIVDIVIQVQSGSPARIDFFMDDIRAELVASPDEEGSLTYDLLEYMRGDGRIYELRYNWGGGGQQRFQTHIDNQWFYQVKDGEWEEMRADNRCIYRGTDTSAGMNLLYTLTEEGKYGSSWVPRRMREGQLYRRCPTVVHRYKNTGHEVPDKPSFQHVTWIRLEAVHARYTLPSNIELNDVAVLAAYEEDGNGQPKITPFEQYFYAKHYGLVAWKGGEHMHSYMIGESPGDTPLEREVIGSWLDRLRDVGVYVADDIDDSIVVDEPVEKAMIILTPTVDTLPVRQGPGEDYTVMTQLHTGEQATAVEEPEVVLHKLGQEDEWVHLQTPSNFVGWSPAWLLCEVSEPVVDVEAGHQRALDFKHDPKFVQLPVCSSSAITALGGFGPNNWSYKLYREGENYYNYALGLHSGLDFFVPSGTELCAADWGVVAHVSSGENDNPFGAGKFSLIVRHGQYMVLYGHLKGASPGEHVFVSEGDVVKPGDPLCLSGWDHLHFEMRKIHADFLDELTEHPERVSNIVDRKHYLDHEDYYVNPAPFFFPLLETYSIPWANTIDADADRNGYPDPFDLYSINAIPSSGRLFWPDGW